MLKRTLAILATGAVGALALAPSAGAIENPKLDPYGAGAYANALEITLLGQDLAVSNTSAAITSTPEAKADGAALLLAGNPLPGATPASAPDGTAENQSCALGIDLGELTGGAISLANAGLACVDTKATANATITEAVSDSGELVINITAPAGDVLGQILDPLSAPVTDIVDQVLDALAPLTGGIKDATQIDLDTVVRDLVNSLLAVDPTVVIAQIAVAPTASVARATNDAGVLAQAGSSGATITLLPDLLQSLLDIGLNLPSVGPLAVIKVGPSTAKVERDATTGAAKPDASVAQLLDVKLAPSLGILSQVTDAVVDGLEGLADTVSGALGCNAGNPLADILCIDLGQVKELSTQELQDRNLWYGEGTVGREASAATIRLLPILSDTLGGPAVGLRLGASTAAANATPAEVPAPPTGPTKLPKTGGAAPLSLGFVLLLGAGGAIALVRRTRVIA